MIVWDFKTRQPVYSLIDLNDGNAFSQNRVVQLAFSSDEAFLAGCDDQRGCKLCVWKTQTGELSEVLAGKQPQLAFLQWGRKLQGAKKHASYGCTPARTRRSSSSCSSTTRGRCSTS